MLCEECEKEFDGNINYYKHESTGGGGYICPHCGYVLEV